MQEEKIKIWHYVFVLFIAVALALAVRTFFFEPTLVRGDSMAPTLQDGDRLLLSKMSDINHFDIIVFHTNDHHNLVKRVIGLPGDVIHYEQDTLYVNDEPYEEPYLEENKGNLTDAGPLTNTFSMEDIKGADEAVPDDYLLVLGDNRRISMDSREIGVIPINDVVGVAKAIFFPFRDMGWLGEDEIALLEKEAPQ